jgi:hypothetical protein
VSLLEDTVLHERRRHRQHNHHITPLKLSSTDIIQKQSHISA